MVISVFYQPNMGGEKITLSISGISEEVESGVKFLKFLSNYRRRSPLGRKASRNKVELGMKDYEFDIRFLFRGITLSLNYIQTCDDLAQFYVLITIYVLAQLGSDYSIFILSSKLGIFFMQLSAFGTDFLP